MMDKYASEGREDMSVVEYVNGMASCDGRAELVE
jgi:hypothetical protein